MGQRRTRPRRYQKATPSGVAGRCCRKATPPLAHCRCGLPANTPGRRRWRHLGRDSQTVCMGQRRTRPRRYQKATPSGVAGRCCRKATPPLAHLRCGLQAKTPGHERGRCVAPHDCAHPKRARAHASWLEGCPAEGVLEVQRRLAVLALVLERQPSLRAELSCFGGEEGGLRPPCACWRCVPGRWTRAA